MVFGRSGITQIASEPSMGSTAMSKCQPTVAAAFLIIKAFLFYFIFFFMAASDTNYCFTFVDIGAFGRESDAGVFSHTQFGEQLIHGRLPLPPHSQTGTDVLTPPVFVADEAFPQKIHLMRPYPDK